MDLVADIFLAAGAIGAGLYCYVLARRLNRFNDLEKGVGGAVAVLSSQVEELRNSLDAAQSASVGSSSALEALTTRAETVAGKLELMMASMHDLPEATPDPTPPVATEPTAVASTTVAPQNFEAASSPPVAQQPVAAPPPPVAAAPEATPEAAAPSVPSAPQKSAEPVFSRHGRHKAGAA